MLGWNPQIFPFIIFSLFCYVLSKMDPYQDIDEIQRPNEIKILEVGTLS